MLHSPRNHYNLQQFSGDLNEKQRCIGGWIPSVISDSNQVISSTSSETPIEIAFHFAIVFFVFKRHSNRKLNSNQQHVVTKTFFIFLVWSWNHTTISFQNCNVMRMSYAWVIFHCECITKLCNPHFWECKIDKNIFQVNYIIKLCSKG